MQTGKVRLYACGGAGTNVGSHYTKPSKEEHTAEVVPTFIDTSRSNMKGDIPVESTYILDNLDGSGKVRSENYNEISNVVKQILHQHKPLDFNIVVFSASGGSGSVIGPLILSELLDRGESTVAVVIGSDESVITANNTLNTLKSLDGISRKFNKPVVMHYRHNTKGRARSSVDNELLFAIDALSVLASRQINSLDTMDIKNWLQFDKTTSIKPRLAALEIFDRTDAPWNEYTPLSVISIYNNPDEPTIPVTPEYHCAGYADLKKGDLRNIHFMIDVDVVPKYAATIQRTLGELNDARLSRPALSNIVSDKDNMNDRGIVL